MTEPRVFWEITPVRTITRYFEDGTVELWLSDEDNNELYLIKSQRYPSGKSPVVSVEKQKDEL